MTTARTVTAVLFAYMGSLVYVNWDIASPDRTRAPGTIRPATSALSGEGEFESAALSNYRVARVFAGDLPVEVESGTFVDVVLDDPNETAYEVSRVRVFGVVRNFGGQDMEVISLFVKREHSEKLEGRRVRVTMSKSDHKP